MDILIALAGQWELIALGGGVLWAAHWGTTNPHYRKPVKAKAHTKGARRHV